MRATILGSGGPLGMPVPMCDCDYCETGPQRLRAGLIVETEEATLVFDISPDIRQQLIQTGKEEVDAFFPTHAHFDHFGGFPDLNNLKKFTESEIQVYGSEAVQEYINEVFSWTDVDFEVIDERKEIGDLKVEVFMVEHNDYLPMQGFSITKDDKKVVYIPDLKSLDPSDKYKDADILFVDGMYLFDEHVENEDHASGSELKNEIEKVGADRVVLLGNSEHFNQMTLQEEKEETEYQLGEDFEKFEV